MKILKLAETLGRELAEYLNEHPEEAQNWSRLDIGDDMPNEDYRSLSRVGEVTSEVEKTYKDAFNSCFLANVFGR